MIMRSNVHVVRLQNPESRTTGCDLRMWDGRLDNRVDLGLRFEHLLRGERQDDAFLARAAYDQEGVPGLCHLIGDWSLVIRDPRTGEVVLASDFAGIRPLYYVHDSECVICSVSLRSLVEHTAIDALDERYMAGFLTEEAAPNFTPYKGIRSVPPGHAVCVSRTSTRISQFWSLAGTDSCRYRDERLYDEHLRTLFRDAVAARLDTAAPVVAELSGGFDSSSVVSMASRLIRRGEVASPRLTTVSYVHRGSLDLPFIRSVEAFCQIKSVHLSTHDTPLFCETDEADATPQIGSPLLRAAASVARASGARTFMTGQAGDQLLGNWIDDSLQVARSIRRGRPDLALVEALAWSKVTGMPVVSILSRVVAAMLSTFVPAFVENRIAGGKTHADTSLSAAFAKRTGANDPGVAVSNEWKHAPPERRPHLRTLTLIRELRILQPLEPMRDLEYTHPFMHRPLVEFLMRIPSDVLCKPGQPRLLMRRALAHLWPPALRARRSKSLFGGPYLDAFRPFATRLLADERPWLVVDRGWVDRASLRRRLERLSFGVECNASQLRQILLLEHWLRDFSQRERRQMESVPLVS
jgi:asparagine synthase (glutamine-hydrolysing)